MGNVAGKADIYARSAVSNSFIQDGIGRMAEKVTGDKQLADSVKAQAVQYANTKSPWAPKQEKTWFEENRNVVLMSVIVLVGGFFAYLFMGKKSSIDQAVVVTADGVEARQEMHKENWFQKLGLFKYVLVGLVVGLVMYVAIYQVPFFEPPKTKSYYDPKLSASKSYYAPRRCRYKMK